ncbi:histidine phosphatase family protein [Ramlibacter sp. 2FC]|uniref:histidine phosphatase family protein n=1 Tax=Ramlibacter sp. 2FC TaxID=2502188 RepID=UPI0010F671EF|nr:histidine phosphatase family protein [Ramlibacter sp. 2FC]
MACDRFRSFSSLRSMVPPLLAMAFSLMSAAQPVAQEEPLPGLPAVLGELRKGGLVIYFRHGLTEQSGSTDEAADLARCETQRQLSAEGREQSRRTGQAFRTLRIPVGSVVSSPFCRCKDTAQLAFGHHTVDKDLHFAINADATETRRLALALRLLLSTPPKAATNSVIVAHTANLREAAGIWPKPEGVAYVFRPLPGGRFEALAKVLPEDWAKAAEAKR